IILIKILKDMGTKIEHNEKEILVKKALKIKPIDVKTKEYPGFPTDLQPLLAVLLTQANGQSMIFETIFEGRLGYVDDLNRMGAKIIICDPHRILINGPTPLRGREIETPDLRAGLAFVLAGAI
ncbi:MAG: UDP-N-acetylglucosamine 1-carboxyvinyltransferase, partial [Pseudothermotoga sp.]|nr:UDP-N-acetylglucosamine 1-carboxyvinyltransferase [Pseudothermotoga sp.]